MAVLAFLCVSLFLKNLPWLLVVKCLNLLACGGCLICCAYCSPGQLGPSDLASVFSQEFMSLGMSQRQPWFCVGDFNEIPGSSVVETVMESFGGVVRSCGLPTRWKGERCVDWAMANCPHNASVPWLLSTAISDHIPLAFDVVLTAGPLLRGTLQSGPSWVKPSGVPLDLWRQVVELCWSRHPCVDQLSQVLLSDRLDVQVEMGFVPTGLTRVLTYGDRDSSCP
jgi:hypothetical protein